MTADGYVSLVGAGPGAADLLTLRAVDRLRRADLVLYDGLVPTAVIDVAERAERVSVARRVGPKTLTQTQVNDLMIAGARAGRRVVRLKSGDPFVFGRGGEEVEALAAAGVAFEVVPGLSTAIAAPTLAGIPVTHREVASGVVVVSGHDAAAYRPLLGSLPPGAGTVVALMAQGHRAELARFLLDLGWSGDTPTALVSNASQPDQHVWFGRLATLGTDDGAEIREGPGVVVIGEVVSLSGQWAGAAGVLQRSTHGRS